MKPLKYDCCIIVCAVCGVQYRRFNYLININSRQYTVKCHQLYNTLIFKVNYYQVDVMIVKIKLLSL